MASEITEKLFTKEQVLKILPISARTLARRRWDGSLRALAVNSRFFLYPESSITDFLAKLHAGKLQTTTFDGIHRPRAKRASQKRRERSSRKAARLFSSTKGEIKAPARSRTKKTATTNKDKTEREQ